MYWCTSINILSLLGGHINITYVMPSNGNNKTVALTAFLKNTKNTVLWYIYNLLHIPENRQHWVRSWLMYYAVFIVFCLSLSCVMSAYYFQCHWIVHSSLLLLLSLECPFFIASSVFSGLSILHCFFCFL